MLLLLLSCRFSADVPAEDRDDDGHPAGADCDDADPYRWRHHRIYGGTADASVLQVLCSDTCRVEIHGDFHPLEPAGAVPFDASCLTRVTGNVELRSASATLVPTFPALSEIGGDLYLFNNRLLSDLDGFGAVETIGGTLRLAYNPKLSTLQGLSSLQQAGGLEIERTCPGCRRSGRLAT